MLPGLASCESLPTLMSFTSKLRTMLLGTASRSPRKSTCGFCSMPTVLFAGTGVTELNPIGNSRGSFGCFSMTLGPSWLRTYATGTPRGTGALAWCGGS